MEIQEYRGIRGLVAAEVLTDTTEEITFGTPFAVAGVAELSKTTKSSTETHYYDNAPAVALDSTGADEVTISASAIPLDVYGKLTGQRYDEAKGMLVEGVRESKYFAIGYITKNTSGTEIFVWRLKGKFNVPDFTHNTEDDGAEANGQELVFTGIMTTNKCDENGTKPAKAAIVDTGKNKNVTETAFFAKVHTPDEVPPVTAA